MRLLVIWDLLEQVDLENLAEQTGAEILRGESKEEILQLASKADVIFGFASRDVLAQAVNCQWLQIPYAGAETILSAKWGNPQMYFTNGSGIFGPPIAEHVLGMILTFNRGLHLARDRQKQRNWTGETHDNFRELTNATVGILGFGDLGLQVAKRLQGFNCKIIGFRQHPQGNEPHVSAVYKLDDFPQHASKLDYLVCALPHTAKTVGFLNKEKLRLLAKHAIIVNVGRGSLIPTDDLILALKKGWIAGAALDVTDPEPLPIDNPLWSMENVLITPHSSGLTPHHKERALAIFLENWRHFQLEGEPKLNRVDAKLGY